MRIRQLVEFIFPRLKAGEEEYYITRKDDEWYGKRGASRKELKKELYIVLSSEEAERYEGLDGFMNYLLFKWEVEKKSEVEKLKKKNKVGG